MRVPSSVETDQFYADGVTPVSRPVVILKCDYCYGTADLFGYDSDTMELMDAGKVDEHICEKCLSQFARMSGMSWKVQAVNGAAALVEEISAENPCAIPASDVVSPASL